MVCASGWSFAPLQPAPDQPRQPRSPTHRRLAPRQPRRGGSRLRPGTRPLSSERPSPAASSSSPKAEHSTANRSACRRLQQATDAPQQRFSPRRARSAEFRLAHAFGQTLAGSLPGGPSMAGQSLHAERDPVVELGGRHAQTSDRPQAVQHPLQQSQVGPVAGLGRPVGPAPALVAMSPTSTPGHPQGQVQAGPRSRPARGARGRLRLALKVRWRPGISCTGTRGRGTVRQ